MRRTGTRVRGRRFAAVLAAAAVAVGVAGPAAFAVDPIRPQEWHLDAMHAQEMWQTSTGSGVTVAVIDDGVKADHPDLLGQLVDGMDFSGQPGGVTSPRDDHGTAMVSIIVGSGKGLNGQGAYGLAPGAKVMPIKINSAGGNSGGVSGSDYLKQIDQSIIYAADHGVKIINLSQGIGQGEVRQDDVSALKAAVDHATSRGALIFAAAGNSGDTSNEVEYPAAIQGVVGVAAVGRDSKSMAESEHGPQVALSAPGEDIYAACTFESGYCKGHGTSDATALASASAALVWSAHPGWTNNQVLRVLINTAGKPQDGSNRSDSLGYGIVRPRIALSSPGDPGPADVSPLAAAAPTGGASSPAAGASAPAVGPTGNTPATGAVVASPAKKSSSMGLIVGGVAVGLLVLVVIVVLIARNSRKGSTPPPMAPMPGGYPGPQPPQAPYGGGYPMQQPPAPGGYPQQPPVQPGAFPPPPQQGQNPPQGGNPYGR